MVSQERVVQRLVSVSVSVRHQVAVFAAYRQRQYRRQHHRHQRSASIPVRQPWAFLQRRKHWEPEDRPVSEQRLRLDLYAR